MRPSFQRVLLKISGEVLQGADEYFNPTTIERIAKDIRQVTEQGIEVCLVIGGGNIFRGEGAKGIERVTADHIGILATVMNALIFQSVLESLSIQTRVLSAVAIDAICEPYHYRRAIRHMRKGRLVIFAAGLGHPYLTTDTCAVLRASEMGCDHLLKGTKVDGVYSADPETISTARHYPAMTYQDVIRQDLRVMDLSAIALARDARLPIIVFSIQTANGFSRVLNGDEPYTLISDQP